FPQIVKTNVFSLGIKYYVNTKARITLMTDPTLSIFIGSTGAGITQNNPVLNQWYDITGIITPNTNTTFFVFHSYSSSAKANGSTLEIDYAYAFNISTLITNNIYSPL